MPEGQILVPEKVDVEATYVLSVEQFLEEEEFEQIQHAWIEKTVDDNGRSPALVIIGGGMKLTQLDDEVLARLGLQRIDPYCLLCRRHLRDGGAHGPGICGGGFG